MKTVTKEQLEKLPHKFQVAFALFCAKQVSHLNTDERVHDCIEVVDKWLEGKATADAAAHAARAAYGAAVADARAAGAAAAVADARAARAADAAADAAAAAYAAAVVAYGADARAARAAYAAAVVAYGADAAVAAYAAAAVADAAVDKEKIIEEQNRHYEELLNFDNIVEAELFKTIE